MNNRNSTNHVQNVKNYIERKKKRYQIMVDLQKDQDVITWFDAQRNCSGAVRQLVRDKINGRKASNQAIAKLRQKRREQHVCIYCAEPDERTLSGKACCQKCFDKARERNVK